MIKINDDKDQLKIKIQNAFTKIRNALNEREDQLLLEINNIFDSRYFNEDIIKKSQNLPNKIKISLKNCKDIPENEWNNENKINLLINNCINIENYITNINIINEKINKYNKYNIIKIKLFPFDDDDEFNKILDNIKAIWYIDIISVFYDSWIINNNKVLLKIYIIGSIIKVLKLSYYIENQKMETPIIYFISYVITKKRL